MVDFGTDLSCRDDVDSYDAMSSGWSCLVDAIYRRLITPRGALIDDPDYGYDVTSLIDDAMTSRQVAIVAMSIDNELQKDERVLASKTVGSFTRGKYTASTTVTTSNGPFRLVLSIDSVTVDVLSTGLEIPQ